MTATGSKLWRWKYRFTGKEKRLALGQYPAVPSATRLDPGAPGGILKGARELRDDARALLPAGTDPGETRREAKRAILAAHETASAPVARAALGAAGLQPARQGGVAYPQPARAAGCRNSCAGNAISRGRGGASKHRAHARALRSGVHTRPEGVARK